MSEHPLTTNLVLIGFMGSGKSSVGRLLATYLGFQFVDTDTLVIQAAGMPIADIFARYGEAAFRDQEAEALSSLAGKRQLIVSTGGGIVTRPSNLPLLRQLGFVVALMADEAVIYERVSRNNKRPLLHTADPRRTISELLASRAPLYGDAAQFSVDTTQKTHSQVADTIIQEARLRYPPAE
jgi:shikimate kinase